LGQILGELKVGRGADLGTICGTIWAGIKASATFRTRAGGAFKTEQKDRFSWDGDGKSGGKPPHSRGCATLSM
jgi:hypothetical protein